MKILRYAAVVLIAAAAAAALRSCVVRPLHCQRVVREMEDRTREAMASPPLVGRNTARANIGALIRCEDSQPPDINLYMLLGANYQIVEEWDRAVAAYESALRIDRRPEIYLSLGTCHLETGEEQKAIDAFVAACAFAPAMIEEVPAAIREQVTGRIEEEYGRDWLR